MTSVESYLIQATKDAASDLFFVAGAPVSYKLDGHLIPLEESKLTPQQSENLIRQIYGLAERDIEPFLENGDDDFSFSIKGLSRFRVNTYRQRGSWATVIRIVAFSVPKPEDLGIVPEVMKLSSLTSGMVLVTGTAGCGKSTTLACLVDSINRNRACHIITLEDPIEYLHRNQKSIVSQREIAVDTADYHSALRACLRQAPDVIQLGEMRDADAIHTAMTAAETGHLLFATLHTHGAVNSIDRIIDTFPADQQEQVRFQLSTVLKAVVSQQLLPGVDGELVPAFEILHINAAVRSMIRDNKNHQIPSVIASGGEEGMLSMDQSILNLYQQGKITAQVACDYADNADLMKRRIPV
jgi:twitching motility protein PilT